MKEILYRWITLYLGWAGGILYGGSVDAPDYVGAAEKQAQAQKDMGAQSTWANRPNQTTPWGSSTWSSELGKDPATGADITKWSQTQTLDPTIQKALDSQIGVQGDRSKLAKSMMTQVAADTAKPFDWKSMPAAGSAVGPHKTEGNKIQENILAPGQQTSVVNNGDKINTTGPSQTTQTTNETGFNAQRDQVFKNQMDRLAPLHQQAQESQDVKLANMGFAPGSEAYKRAQTALVANQSADRFNALNNATSQQQAMQSMLLGQQQQAFGQDEASRAAGNTALGQQFGQNVTQGNFANIAKQNEFAQNQGQGNFANAAAGQQFNQNLGMNAQNYAQQLESSRYQNQLRQQGIAEQAQARGMSLNEMNALMSGQQVQNPQTPNFTSAQGNTAPNYLAAATAQGNYNTANQNDWGAGLGGIASLISQLRT